MQAEHAYQAQGAFSLDNLFTARKLRARVASTAYRRITHAHIRGLIQPHVRGRGSEVLLQSMSC
jgi:hypothetical protein